MPAEPNDVDRPQIRDEFAETSLGELVDVLVPRVPDAAIRRLEELLRNAQTNTPQDKAGFVAQVNRILDAQLLRLRVGDRLARLRMKHGSIQLSYSEGGGSGGFLNVPIQLERVPPNYGRRGSRTAFSESEPS